ncbi:Oidioi.mRNA.OKI2018_I69.XSR.g14604.t1.cds [Oikopleura dioica]|uniref:Oidioi.mRNA.OKI2018_I69.XSR.g14604.t1.cds n=1 Tax=Oikopleura dioica TaxID=34765 RepID=A0ABN7SAA0_OIKDI|nr:Oidioi.mRNA.OKI2018_I69.XSR.g14604.t1.cds [Oikopleura dioica]
MKRFRVKEKSKREHTIVRPNSIMIPRREIYTVIDNGLQISFPYSGNDAEEKLVRYLHKALSKIGYKDDAIQELQEKSSKKNLKKFFVIFTTVACAQKLMDRHPRTFDGFRINIQEAVVPPFEIPSVKRRESPLSTPPVQSPSTPHYDPSYAIQAGYAPPGAYVPQESYAPPEGYASPELYAPAEAYVPQESYSPVEISQSMQKMDLNSPSPAMDSGIQSDNSSDNPQSNQEIAQSMGMLPMSMDYAFQSGCVFCIYNMPHPTVNDMPALMDGSWYNQMSPYNFNQVLSFINPY